MNAARWMVAGVLAVATTSGLASATGAPAPPAEPIGDVLINPSPSQPPAQSQPPVVSVTPIAPTVPIQEAGIEAQTITAARSERAVDGAPRPVGTPLPELADPLPRTRQGFAVVQALDKVTAETIRFVVPVGQQRRWRGLVFRARACETTAADEPMRDSMAYLEIYSQPRARDGAIDPRRIFQGWMFASSPGLSGMQHPLYDAWVISCQAEAPSDA